MTWLTSESARDQPVPPLCWRACRETPAWQAGRPSTLRELGFDRRGIEHGEYRMKQNAILVVTSLLSILLLTLHITDDIVRGISKAEPSNTALLILAVFLYGTLVLAERRSGHVIMLLV